MIKEIYVKQVDKNISFMNDLKQKVEKTFTFIVNGPGFIKDMAIPIKAENEGEAVKIFFGEYEDKILEEYGPYNYSIK